VTTAHRPGRASSRGRAVGRLARLAAQGLVVALVAGSTTAFAMLHKQVTVDVDGTPVQVEAFGRSVADVLSAADVQVGERDLVVPALDQTVAGGATVVVRHTHALALEVDGETSTVWTTALTVGEAVDALGVRAGSRLSASRSDPLGRELRVSTTKTIHLAVDGQLIDGLTAAGTVRDALKEIGLVLDDGDQVSVPLDAPAVDGLVVMVTRAATSGETVTEAIPFETQVVEDPKQFVGTQTVQQQGRAGVRTTTYDVEMIGGVVVSRTLVASAVTTPPVAQVVVKGSKAVPTIVPDPGSAQAIAQGMLPAYGWGDDQFACLVELWAHESGWRVNAGNPTTGAYGIPQALPGSKMATAGADWQTNPATQITWGLGYIAGRYGSPCQAYSFWASHNWY
jgi:uncharacterized protein YabE (DUF348 family)